MDAEQVLAFRLARSGLARRTAGSLAEAAACPASDFSRDAALLALAARHEGVTRAAYDEATEHADVVLAHLIRGAIHASAPDGFAQLGQPLMAESDEELGPQLGRQVQQLCAEKERGPAGALDEVADATRAALAGGRRLDRNELHAALRERVSEDLLPWCRSCESHHVSPMLWRFALVRIGARLDAERRHVLDDATPAPVEDAGGAVRRFLRFYAPATPHELAEWAGLAKPHARRLWAEVEPELYEVGTGPRPAWALEEDRAELESPPQAHGVRLLPPGDPFLQRINRPLLAPDEAVRKRFFRAVASPGGLLADGRLAGLWRTKARGDKIEIAVERLGRFKRAGLEEEAQRLADLRGATRVELSVDR